jgi:hypothetical protein
MSTIVAAIKKQRIVWSCALLVSLFLLLVGHLPAVPVLAGCALAITYVTVRSPQSRQPKLKTAPAREARRT